MLRFSANLGFLWPGQPPLERIEAAAAAGFKAIELHWPYDVPPEAVRAACERLNVTLLGINAARGDPAQGEFGLAALPGREADFRASFDMALAWCRAAGGSAIHVLAGRVDAAGRAAARDTFVANLREAAAKAPDLTLLLEPMNRRDSPRYFYSTVEEAGDVMERVGAPNVRIMFDAYHIAIAEGDVLMRLRKWVASIAHVQIAAVPSRAEPDEGEIAYRAVFDELENLGYEGWIGCEYRPRAGTDEGLAWIARLGVAALG